MSLGELAFRAGRRIGKHPVAGRLFCLTERLLPVKRVARSESLVAFHHPRPVTNPHVLIVPTKPMSALTSDRLSEAEKYGTIWQMIDLARVVAGELPHNELWQLVINGGERQDIGQLHAHLLHTDIHHENGMALSDPTSSADCWREIFAKIQEAAAIPGNGYSLHIRWGPEGHSIANVTQDLRT